MILAHRAEMTDANISGNGDRRRRGWLPLLILVVAVAAAAALIATKPKPDPVVVSERAWPVATTTAVRRAHRPSVTLYGRLESLWSSQLTAGITADVVEVTVVEGDSVEKGALLVRLDDRDARLLLAQREAELEQAEARIASEIRRHEANLEALPRERRLLSLTRSEVSRLQDLVEKKVGAQSQLDTARQAAEKQAIALSAREQSVDEHAARLAEVEAARNRTVALRDQALLELERSEIRAPFNGRVAEVLVAPGRRVRGGDALVELFDTDALIVRAQIPSRFLPAVRVSLDAGEKIRVSGSVDSMPLDARLMSLAGEARGGTGGVDGLFRIVEGGASIAQGRFVRLALALPETPDLFAVPHEAIYGTDRVYVVDGDQRMRARQVERIGELRGGDDGNRILIRSPALRDGAQVVVTQLPNALDGLLVKAVDGD